MRKRPRVFWLVVRPGLWHDLSEKKKDAIAFMKAHKRRGDIPLQLIRLVESLPKKRIDAKI